jgi:hypothetical protein
MDICSFKYPSQPDTLIHFVSPPCLHGDLLYRRSQPSGTSAWQSIEKTCAWLSLLGERGLQFNGAIYLGALEENFGGGQVYRNHLFYRVLSGSEFRRYTVIASTGWDRLDYQVAVKRERRLMQDDDHGWAYIIKLRGSARRFIGTANSAGNVVRGAVEDAVTPGIPLKVQRQLIHEQKRLKCTYVGAWMGERLEREKRDFERLLKDTLEELALMMPSMSASAERKSSSLKSRKQKLASDILAIDKAIKGLDARYPALVKRYRISIDD